MQRYKEAIALAGLIISLFGWMKYDINQIREEIRDVRNEEIGRVQKAIKDIRVELFVRQKEMGEDIKVLFRFHGELQVRLAIVETQYRLASNPRFN